MILRESKDPDETGRTELRSTIAILILFYERGLNENQNLFIRRFIPKGMNFDDLTNKEVKEIERWINTYPRKLFEGNSATTALWKNFRRENRKGGDPLFPK